MTQTERAQCGRERFATAAAELIGTPFRLHGRDPATGIDCVGLVICALQDIGIQPDVLSGYSLRNTSVSRFLVCAPASGLTPVGGTIATGDVLLVEPGPGQQHLVIAETSKSFIHAHASLRRIVRHTGCLPWPVSRHWRLSPEY